jgi:hypothetical protein
MAETQSLGRPATLLNFYPDALRKCFTFPNKGKRYAVRSELS